MGFHPHWSCFTLRSVTKGNLLNGFPFSLELFYSSNCDQSQPLKWVSILTGVVLPFVLWPKRTFEMGFHSHWSCFTLRSVTKNLWNGNQSEPLKWVSILTGVVLPFVLWPKTTFEMGFHSLELFSFVLWPKWTFEMGFHLTGVVLLFVLWPKTTFVMGFHSHWSCFTLSVTKYNLWNGFPFSLELCYPSFCDQSEPLKWVSILTGVVLPFVLWQKTTFEMGFHPHWSCFTVRSVNQMGFHPHWSCFTSFCDQREPFKWVSILTGVVLLFELCPKWTF